MEIKVVTTDRAPHSPSPLSQAIRYGQFLFVSGQVPLDPGTGEMVPGDIREQTRQVMKNVQAIIEAAGGSMSQVVKTTCFLTDIGDAPAFNEEYAKFFPAHLPARSTYQVGALAQTFKVEVEAIACISTQE